MKKGDCYLEEPKIKEKYKQVAIHYVGDCIGNGEKSLIAAGYSPAYARGNASKVIAKSCIQQYIKYLNSLNMNKNIATIEEIQTFWTTVMNSSNCKTSDRLKASELLAKCKGAFDNDW